MIFLWHYTRFVDFDKPPYVCPQCGRRSRLCMRHDAYYCPACDIWLEPVCGSERCKFCAARPERPSQVTDASGEGDGMDG